MRKFNNNFYINGNFNYGPVLNYKIKNVVDFSVKVMSEDSHACELNQQGVYNPAYKTGILMPEEYEIKRFHDWLRKKLI